MTRKDVETANGITPEGLTKGLFKKPPSLYEKLKEVDEPPKPESLLDEAEPNKSSGRAKPVNQLNDLTAKEWIPETVSVWVQRGLGKNHEHAEIEKQHPAPFSYQDISRLIRFFTKSGETVLDPFVGVGSTLKAAAMEGRKGIGIELNSKYVNLAEKRLKSELNDDPSICHSQKIIHGDARVEIPKIAANSVRLVVTSPPYWNILHKQDHKVKQERLAHGLDTQYSRNTDRPRQHKNLPGVFENSI